MFVRSVSINVKPNSVAEFRALFDAEVIPLLRTQPGFRDEFAFANDSGTHVTAISIWESREQADAFQLTGYVQSLKILVAVIDGTPKVRTSSVINSTLQMPSVATTV